MKVAIMGAGLAGLACAIELERHGIEPHIFERRSRVGDRYVNGEAFVSLFSRPILDEVRYLSEYHRIDIQPASHITELVVHSASQKASLTGPIGFFTIRGRHPDALENQLARQVQSDIHFHSDASYEDLVRSFTHVVVATGDAAYAQKLKLFTAGTSATLCGATVEGAFDRTRGVCWFDNRFAPHGGYGFLVPYSPTEASLALVYPELKEIDAYDTEGLWNRFFERATADLEQGLKVTDSFESNHYLMGECLAPRVGNTFLVGNCFGAAMPFLGFGQFASILTGIYAAKDISGEAAYEQLTVPLRRSYQRSVALRRLMETLDNADMDQIIPMLNGTWGHRLVHSKVNALKWASYGARLWLAMTGKEKI